MIHHCKTWWKLFEFLERGLLQLLKNLWAEHVILLTRYNYPAYFGFDIIRRGLFII